MDGFLVCLLCGDLMEMNEQQIKIFGKPKCCETRMLPINRKDIYKIIKALDILKDKLEKETIKELM